MSLLDYTVSVAITSFDRPEYLKECIASLEKQTDLDDVEFVLTQDGAVNKVSGRQACSQDKIDECIALFDQSNLPNKSKIISPDNIGIAFNHTNAYNECFDNRQRRAMILTEEDLVYNEDWLRVTKVLMRQFQDNTDIATVQASCQGAILNPENRQPQQDWIHIGKPNWLGFAIWNDRWERMKPFYHRYLDMVKQYDYSKRDHESIRRWYTANVGIPETMTSQDRAKEWACVFAKMARIFTPSNRAKYIGEHGVHGTPTNFKATGYDKMVSTRLEGDQEIEEFILMGSRQDPIAYSEEMLLAKKVIS